MFATAMWRLRRKKGSHFILDTENSSVLTIKNDLLPEPQFFLK